MEKPLAARKPLDIDFRIRAATPGDAAGIATLHARSWRAAYRGILPDDYLDGRATAELAAHWADIFERPRDTDIVLVLQTDGDIAGFAAARLAGEAPFDAVIDNLHLAPDQRGSGLGRPLLGSMAQVLAARGAANACLWLFDGNTAAGRFYARLGGVPDVGGFDEVDGRPVPHTRIVFQPLARLIALCRAPQGNPGGIDAV
ncbi:hypothetical protein STVA_51710 [Allostella vacuolata]|nr:hypothetical protein STVA_51710 [Stella vacuolata]